MSWAALIAWVVTAGGGFVMLALWLRHGGMRQRERGRIRPIMILGHFAVAATGLVLWIVYVANDSGTLAWVAFALLVLVALVGFTMFGIWASQRSKPDVASAEKRFPVPIVAVHGLAAATTLVLVFLAAAGVGGS